MGISIAYRCLICGEVVQPTEVGRMFGCTCGNVRLDALEAIPAGRTRVLIRDRDKAERVPEA